MVTISLGDDTGDPVSTCTDDAAAGDDDPDVAPVGVPDGFAAAAAVAAVAAAVAAAGGFITVNAIDDANAGGFAAAPVGVPAGFADAPVGVPAGFAAIAKIPNIIDDVSSAFVLILFTWSFV